MTDEQSTPKLHIDSDWKAEAQREKERLAQKEAQKEQAKAAAAKGPGSPALRAGSHDPAASGSPGLRAESHDPAASSSVGAPGSESRGTGAPAELPEPNFRALVGLLASQAIMGLGAMADPQTNRVIVDLEGARFAIDLLDVLEEKTKGNLTDEEAKDLRQILAELRNRFVQIANLVARQMAQGPIPTAPAGGVSGGQSL